MGRTIDPTIGLYVVHDGGEAFTYAARSPEEALAAYRTTVSEKEWIDEKPEVEGPLPADQQHTVMAEDIEPPQKWRGTTSEALETFLAEDLKPGEAREMWSTIW